MPEVETADDGARAGGSTPPEPGVVVLVENGEPALRAYFLRRGPLWVGRADHNDIVLADAAASSRHGMIELAKGGFLVRDAESRNGTGVDRVLLDKANPTISGAVRVVRMGGSVMLLVQNAWPFADPRMVTPGQAPQGRGMSRAYGHIADAARAGKTCLLRGESGVGKEYAARHYHASSGRRGFFPVNCAAIPTQLAETLLFGGMKGAYSGAVSDTQGYFEAADGGVLFLDEVGTLSLDVQAKLLRVLENKEILPIGSTKPKRVDVVICAATNADLEAEVDAGRFRGDLYMRLSQVQVDLLPLRERPEEIPHFVSMAADEAGMKMHAAVYGECLLRAFSGTNIRGLKKLIAQTAQNARDHQREKALFEDMPAPAASDRWPEPPPLPLDVPVTGPLLSKQEHDLQEFKRWYAIVVDAEEAAAKMGRKRSWGYKMLAILQRDGK